MTQGTHALNVHVHTDLPPRWQVSTDDGCAIALTGPNDGGVHATIRVETARDAGTVEAAAASLADRLKAQRPGTLLVSSDVWPHPTFGDGRYLQSARIENGVALAHDVYVFVSDGVRVEIAVECALADLLGLEEEVATIVARLATGSEDGR